MHILRAQHNFDVGVSCSAFFAVLVQYERYPDIFPQVCDVAVRARDSVCCRVELAARIVVSLQLTLRFVEEAPGALRWTLADANLIPQMSGSWTLTPISAGAACRAAFALEVKLAGQIPQSVENHFLTQTLPGMLEGLRAYAEHVGPGVRKNASPS